MTNRDSTEPLVVAPSLRAAYEAADYEVQGLGTRAVLRIAAPTPTIALDGAQLWRRVAVITAWNPFSATLSAEANAARQARLVREVERAGRVHLPALGRDPAGAWPPEPSLAVLDPSDDELDDWMLAFGQNAVVVAEAGGVCELRFHPHECARVAADGHVGERAAGRLWASAWNALELDLLEGALHRDVVYTSHHDGATLLGRADVTELLRRELLALRGVATRRARVSASVQSTTAPDSVRPRAVLFQGEATTPTAVVLFTLRHGSIARVDVCKPELQWPQRLDNRSSDSDVCR